MESPPETTTGRQIVPDELAGQWFLKAKKAFIDGTEQQEAWPDSVFLSDSFLFPDGAYWPDSVFIDSLEKNWFADSAFTPNTDALTGSVFALATPFFWPDSVFTPDSKSWPDSVFFPDVFFNHFRTMLEISENGSAKLVSDVFWDTTGFGSPLGTFGQLNNEPTLEMSFVMPGDNVLALSSAEQDYTTPLESRAAFDGNYCWPKQWSVDGDTLTLVSEWSIDGTDYRLEQEFAKSKPAAPDFGGLLGWWEYTGKDTGFEDFIHFAPMDLISAHGYDDGTSTAGPFGGNLAMWGYNDDVTVDGMPEPGEAAALIGASAGYTRAEGELTFHQGGSTTTESTYSINNDTLTINYGGTTTLTYDRMTTTP